MYCTYAAYFLDLLMFVRIYDVHAPMGVYILYERRYHNIHPPTVLELERNVCAAALWLRCCGLLLAPLVTLLTLGAFAKNGFWERGEGSAPKRQNTPARNTITPAFNDVAVENK